MAKNDATNANELLDAQMYVHPKIAVSELQKLADLTPPERHDIHVTATELVQAIRTSSDPGLMEVFLAEYGLSTDEGVALMCLAEALLRVPDAQTMDDLIEDKIAPSDWGKHLGKSASSLVNASTWALMLTGRVLDDETQGVIAPLKGAIKRLGEPVIRSAVTRAMREMGRQFVLGETISKAMDRAQAMQAKGYTYSYDMLGEAARTEADAKAYHLAYSKAISAIADHCTGASVAENPGISVKLSALHPRYEVAQKDRVMTELVPRVRALAVLAKSAGMGFNIDAEEADRLALSLDVINAVLSEPALAGWTGFGVVVQAYGQRAPMVIDHLYALAERLDRQIMVRLVKGAYWDTEIKRAQTEGLNGFPVFTSKSDTDISYIANATKLLGMTDRIYPQFATHNAHTVAAVLAIANTNHIPHDQFEFQRLHGMGEALHGIVMGRHKTRCRIYAPVGAHEDLLAYLVRRLLENGANSSFVNQIVDETVAPEQIAACPFDSPNGSDLTTGPDLFQPQRRNSKGWDLTHQHTLDRIDAGREQLKTKVWQAHTLLAVPAESAQAIDVTNPADQADHIGSVANAKDNDVSLAITAAKVWDVSLQERQVVLNAAADAYEANANEIFALLAREAGKTLPDAVAELREAVDFLRYYAAEATPEQTARGTWACISPWNFPLAIFTGQIAAALATGNAVIAKPAEQTPMIATFAVGLLHSAGVPRTALQVLPGDGRVGAALTMNPAISGVAFTGSTQTARLIRSSLAKHCAPGTPLIAETGGLNAMIVDSTALPEHAVRDILNAAFRSAGQRCSALRCLYVQEDIADALQDMLIGAMDELRQGDPWNLSTDIGPVIDAEAQRSILAHIEAARAEGRIVHELAKPTQGTLVSPTVIAVNGIQDLDQEIFGPVLHMARFKAEDLEDVMEQINETGYGLTFGLHTRIDDRVQLIVDRMKVGNIYVNRDQIGAIVGSQPFGGEGLSGTGPKAGGPHYLPRFANSVKPSAKSPALLHDLPGPTGESNRLSLHPKGTILCLGPDAENTKQQMDMVSALGGLAEAGDGLSDLTDRSDMAGVLWWGDTKTAQKIEKELARREGPIIPLITSWPDAAHVMHERHVCIDTTAAGGNAALLAEVAKG